MGQKLSRVQRAVRPKRDFFTPSQSWVWQPIRPLCSSSSPDQLLEGNTLKLVLHLSKSSKRMALEFRTAPRPITISLNVMIDTLGKFMWKKKKERSQQRYQLSSVDWKKRGKKMGLLHPIVSFFYYYLVSKHSLMTFVFNDKEKTWIPTSFDSYREEDGNNNKKEKKCDRLRSFPVRTLCFSFPTNCVCSLLWKYGCARLHLPSLRPLLQGLQFLFKTNGVAKSLKKKKIHSQLGYSGGGFLFKALDEEKKNSPVPSLIM